MDAEIKIDGPVISDVRLPAVPYSGIDKMTFAQFSEHNLMGRIARDTNKDNWPQWIVSFLDKTDHVHVYPTVIKDSVRIFSIIYK